MTPEYIFSQQYLFDPMPTTVSRLYIPLLIIFSAMIVFALLMLLPKNLDKKIRAKNYYTFLIPGIFGLIYLFCRYEQLPWLGSRAFLAIIVLVFVIWSIINSFWVARYLPKQRKQKIIKERYEKYLPQKKK